MPTKYINLNTINLREKKKKERIGENIIDFQKESLDKTIVRKIIEK